MQNIFCFLCKPKYAEADNRSYKVLLEDESFFSMSIFCSLLEILYWHVLIYHSNLRLSLFTQCCSYISSIHIIAYMLKETQKNGCLFTVQIICMRQNVIDLQEKFQRDNFLMKDEQAETLKYFDSFFIKKIPETASLCKMFSK